MDSNIYRKKAMDRVSSPEQLNEYIKIAGPGIWSILGGLAVVFVSFFVWGFMGSIPETVAFAGTALAPGGKPMGVYCYLPIDETKRLEEGMEVRVSPSYTPKEQFGYIQGTVKSIGKTPVTVETLKILHGDNFAFLSIPSGNVIEVVVGLEERDGILQWSTPKGASIHVMAGSTCTLTVVTAERRPYELLFKQ